MPSWFKKVFSGDHAKATTPPPPPTEAHVPEPIALPSTLDSPALGEPDTSGYESDEPTSRRVVQAPIVSQEAESTGSADGIRIKARVERDNMSCTLMVSQPVLDTFSAWFPEAKWAVQVSPLAEALFAIEGIGSVLLHNSTVTLTQLYSSTRAWEDLAIETGAALRSYLEAGGSIVEEAFLNAMPPTEEISRRIQSCIDMEINPGIASHSGVVTLDRVEGNTVYITMGGGCQGCAASEITLRQGIHQSFRQTVPQIGAIYDETDHSAGTNPYFTELPAGMA